MAMACPRPKNTGAPNDGDSILGSNEAAFREVGNKHRFPTHSCGTGFSQSTMRNGNLLGLFTAAEGGSVTATNSAIQKQKYFVSS